MHKSLRIMGAVAGFVATDCATAQDIIPTRDGANSAVLGSAYNSTSERLGSATCIVGGHTSAGASRSSFSLDQSISEEQLATELGFGIGGRARYGVVEGSAEANFLTKAQSNANSIVLIYKASYILPVDKLISAKRSDLGEQLDKNDERWFETCGDRFVHEIRRGANLFVTIRVDFNSQSKKDEFDAKFKISGPLASANGSLKTASSSFDRSTKVSISAIQQGGDVSKLTSVLGNSPEGVQSYTQCSLGNFDSCSIFIKNVLVYASDTKTGFPAQLAPGASPGAADLSYSTAPYQGVGIYRKMSTEAIADLALARADLSRQFERNYRAATMARRSIDAPMNADWRIKITEMGNIADRNIGKIRPVSQICYDSPAQCSSEVSRLVLEKVNDEFLHPPTFLSYCLAQVGKLNTDAPGWYRSEAYSVSLLLGAADSDPHSGLYINDITCKKANEQLQAANSLTAMSNINLWHISQFANIKRLKIMGASDQLKNVDALSMLDDLQYIDLEDGSLYDISFLTFLEKLEMVVLSNNKIRDITPLANKPYLQSLNLAANNVVDIEPIINDQRLIYVNLQQNPVKDISPLYKLDNLQVVDLRNIPINSSQVKTLASIRPGLKFVIWNIEKQETFFGTADQFIDSWKKNDGVAIQ